MTAAIHDSRFRRISSILLSKGLDSPSDLCDHRCLAIATEDLELRRGEMTNERAMLAGAEIESARERTTVVIQLNREYV
jgi:hypothetical protein